MKSKLSCLVVPMMLLAVSYPVSAQTFANNALNDGEDDVEAAYPSSSGGNPFTQASDSGTGTLGLEFTIDPVASTLDLDSVSFNNYVFPSLSETYPVGFGSSNEVTVTLKFNPVTAVFDLPASSQAGGNSLSPESGYSEPTYSVQAGASLDSNFGLTGSYTLTDSHSNSASGSFSVPVGEVQAGIFGGVQTENYPLSVNLIQGGIIGFEPLSQVFSTSFDGTTIAPVLDLARATLDFGDGSTSSTPFALAVPEPSTWAMLLAGLGGLVLWRARRRRV